MTMVVVKLVETEQFGHQAVVKMGEDIFMTDPDAVTLRNGTLTITAPLSVEAPEGCTVVERPVEPTLEQVRLAVEAVNPQLLEEILIVEQDAHMEDSMGAVVIRAMSRALAYAGEGHRADLG